jgi:hypothetical protein
MCPHACKWYLLKMWGRLEVGKVGAHVRCLGMGQTTSPGWEPPMPSPLSSLLGRNLLACPPWDSIGFKNTWKRKALYLCWQTPPVSTMSPSSASLFSPGRTGDSLSLSKAILPHPIHLLCLDFLIRSTKTRIFSSQMISDDDKRWWWTSQEKLIDEIPIYYLCQCLF